MIGRRGGILAAIVIVFLFALYNNREFISGTSLSTSYSTSSIDDNAGDEGPTSLFGFPKASNAADGKSSPLSPEVLKYFDQAFSLDKPSDYDFPALREQCQHTKWPVDEVYLQCGGMAAGLTSIMSQVKVCLKMALEAGTGIVLPSMPLRDSSNLQDFNFLNKDAYLVYDKWFDAKHLIEQVGKACPQMKILHPDQLDSSSVSVKNRWSIDIGTAPDYHQFQSYFWPGRPFKSFFDQKYLELQQAAFLDPSKDVTKKGINVVNIHSQFLVFRITDDPTGREIRLWSDLSHLIRFREEPRQIVHRLLSHINRPFYGVHFRVENDTIWSSLENQLGVDLDALDEAWVMYGKPGEQKPLVYLACGDHQQVEKFVSAGKARGWEVTHKWQLVESDAETTTMINDLAFDFQGAVDMGIMIQSHFFLGITGSAFSSTVGNARDVTGRYRGSSFTVYDDGNARTHLFNDGDASGYPCCL